MSLCCCCCTYVSFAAVVFVSVVAAAAVSILLQEQSLRSTLVELVGALMASHPKQFMEGPAAEKALCFAESLLAPQMSDDDKAVGLFVCCDILQHLKVEVLIIIMIIISIIINCLQTLKHKA